MRELPTFPSDKLTIIAWPSPGAIDVHDARARYVESYWLGVLGPSATWLIRLMANELEASPSGFVMDMAETAQLLGVGGTGKNSPFVRALGRLVQFEMAQMVNSTTLAARTRVPSLSRRHLLRLPETTRAKHDFFVRQQQQLTDAG